MTPHQTSDNDASSTAAHKSTFKPMPLSPRDEKIAKLVEKPNLKFGGGRFPDGVKISNPEDLD